MNREEKIRHIIERFYDGRTAPEEIRELEEYFKNPPSFLPADLQEERIFFLSLSRLETDIPEIPDILTDRILDNIHSENMKTVARHRKIMTIAAAAVMLVILSVAGVVRISQDKTLSASGNVALQEESLDTTHDNPSTDISSPDDPAAEEVASAIDTQLPKETSPREEVNSQQKKIKTGSNRRRTIAVASSSRNNDGMRIVDDPEEARYITRKVMDLLSRQLKTGRKAAAATDELMKENVNITYNILEENI